MLDDTLYKALLNHLGSRTRRRHGVHPSSLICVRWVTFQLLDFRTQGSVTADNLIILDTGSAYHRMVQEHLANIGKICADTHFEAEVRIGDALPRARELSIRGSADGVFYTPIGNYLFELKSIGTNALSALRKPKPDHLEQVNTYMYCLELDRGVIMYISRGDPALRKFFNVEFSPELWEKTHKKIRLALDSAFEERLPPVKTNNYTCRICPYSYVCVNKGRWWDAESARARASRILDP